MSCGSTWRLSGSEVAALQEAIRSDDLRSITSEWPAPVTLSEKPRNRRKVMPVSDPVNPEHYKLGSIECIDAVKAMLTEEEWRGYLKGTAMVYLWRLGHKDAPEQEAKKTIWYMKWLAGEDPRG